MDDLLARAVEVDPRIAAAAAQADASAARVTQARAALLPRVSATAGYTRNEVASEVTLPGSDPVVITPLDQLDASARVDVPVLDLDAWASLASARACRDSAAAQEQAAAEGALLAVVQAAWELRSATSAREAAAAAVMAQKLVVDRATARRDVGTGSELDLLRATAELARVQGALADADADLAAARRALAARTGVDALPSDLTARERPTGDLAAGARSRPEVEDARAALECQRRTLTARRLTAAPTLSAFAQERVSNATGFSGQAATWAAGASVTWTPIEGGLRAGQEAEAEASVHAATALLAQREREADDGLADAVDRLAAAALTRDAARAQRSAADGVAADVNARFELGTLGATEASQAVRDALDAAVALARAEAAFAVAVESLRVAAGQPLLAARGDT